MPGYRLLRLAALASGVFFPGVGLRAEPPLVVPPASGQPRSGSSKLTEALIASLPRYVPPMVGKAADISPPKEAGGSSEQILSLPPMTVRPLMKEPPSDHGWLTDKGRTELGMKASPGLRIGNIFGLNEGIALAMQQEEEQLAKKKAVLAERVRRITIGDSADDIKIRRLLDAALLRPNTDWLTARGGKPVQP